MKNTGPFSGGCSSRHVILHQARLFATLPPLLLGHLITQCTVNLTRVFIHPMRCLAPRLSVLALFVCGCGYSAHLPTLGVFDSPVPPETLPNPIYVNSHHRDFLWNQVVDSVDDHFRIKQERRVRQIGNILTDGQLDTFPGVGSTYLEPWRGDSASGYEKAHATLQTIRRQAVVTVAPDRHGYFIEVTVLKELEAVTSPEFASSGQLMPRHDNSLVTRRNIRGATRRTGGGNQGWIPLGRDFQLEQKILTDIHGRLADDQAGSNL